MLNKDKLVKRVEKSALSIVFVVRRKLFSTYSLIAILRGSCVTRCYVCYF